MSFGPSAAASCLTRPPPCYRALLLLFGVSLKQRLKSMIRLEVWGRGLTHLAISGTLLGSTVLSLPLDKSCG